MICHPAYSEDASALFNLLTGYSQGTSWNKLTVARELLANRQSALIEREQAHAEAGEPAWIIARMNSLVDPTIIENPVSNLFCALGGQLYSA